MYRPEYLGQDIEYNYAEDLYFGNDTAYCLQPIPAILSIVSFEVPSAPVIVQCDKKALSWSNSKKAFFNVNLMKQKFLFGKSTLPLLDTTFGLQYTLQADDLDSWLQAVGTIELSDLETQFCTLLQKGLRSNQNSWQEQELAMHFIGPMFSLVNFTEVYRYNIFAQRYIEVELGDYLLAGEPDGLIASGYYAPEIPYFAFAEYKRQRDPNGDPAGQALAAMLAGQTLNEDTTKPMYGCYVIGTDWYFMTLVGRSYAISRDYSALSDEVFTILKVLKVLKGIIRERTR